MTAGCRPSPDGGTDVSPIREALAPGAVPGAKLLEPGYMEGTVLLA
jgi:hypothetical protein